MLFNSFEFVVFFVATTIAYYAMPHRFRWLFLLVASCVFYMAFVPVYIAILFFTIAVDYVAGILIESATGHRRRVYLGLSIVANVGVLFVFKYYNFFIDNIGTAAAHLGMHPSLPVLRMLLPIGLSFHTFQAMSYTIEVYRGAQPAERHLGRYALYVMFYPQLVAGPIERPQNLLHQFKRPVTFDYERVRDGLRLMWWGAFKKIVVADRLASSVDVVYDHPRNCHGLAFALASVFFAFQIYYDFAGYTDIARGAAKVLGFELMINFDRPYVSRSVSEFWRRWHISLSSWFKDYVFVPLGGSRVPEGRAYANLLAVFALSGLWHGASWNFVIWGTLNGLYLIVGRALTPLAARIQPFTNAKRHPLFHHALDVVTTFVLIDFAWIFFRAATFADARFIAVHSIVGAASAAMGLAHGSLAALGLQQVFPTRIPVSLALIALVESAETLAVGGGLRRWFDSIPSWGRFVAYEAALVSLVVFGEFEHRQFIYFQF